MTEEMLVCPDCGLSADLVRMAAATEFPEPDDAADSHLHGFPEGPAEVPAGHPEAPVPSEFDSVKHRHPWANIQRCPDCGAGATVCGNGFHGDTPAVYPLPHSDTASWDRDAQKWMEPDDTISSGTPQNAPGGKPLMEMGDLPKTKKKIQDLKGQGIDMADMVYRQTVTDPDTGYASHHTHENREEAEAQHAKAQQQGFLSELVPTMRDHPMHNDAFHDLHGRPTPGIQSSKTASCEDDWCPLFQMDAAWETPIPRNDGQCLCGHPNDMHDETEKCSGAECQCQVLRTKTAHEGPHAGDPEGVYEDPVGGKHPYNKWDVAPAKHDYGPCPDCGNAWWDGHPKCPACGLDTEDLEAAGEFYDRMKNKASKTATDQAPCPECHATGMCDCGGDRDCDKCGGSGVCPRCHGEMVITPGGTKMRHSRRVAARVEPEELQPGNKVMAHFHCNCGIDHTPQSQSLTYVGSKDEDGKTRHTFKTGDYTAPDPRSDSANDYDFDVYKFNNEDNWGDYWAYGSDADPITFHTAKLAAETVIDPYAEPNRPTETQFKGKCIRCGKSATAGDASDFGDGDYSCATCAPLVAQNLDQYKPRRTASHDVQAERDLVMNYLYDNDWDTFEIISQNEGFCTTCGGSGDAANGMPCDACAGTGREGGNTRCLACHGGSLPNGMPCPYCKGTGHSDLATHPRDMAAAASKQAAESCIHGMDPDNCFDCQNPKAKAPTDIPNAEPGARGTGMKLRDWERKLLEKGAGSESCIHGIDPENCFDCNNPKSQAPTDIPNAEPGARGTGMKLRDWERKLLEKGAHVGSDGTSHHGIRDCSKCGGKGWGTPGQDPFDDIDGRCKYCDGEGLNLWELSPEALRVHSESPASDHTAAVTAPADGMIGVLYGDDGDTYQSVDGGMTWDKVGGFADMVTKGLDAVDEAVTSKCSGGCGCQTGQCKCANCSGSLNKPQAQPGVVE